MPISRNYNHRRWPEPISTGLLLLVSLLLTGIPLRAQTTGGSEHTVRPPARKLKSIKALYLDQKSSPVLDGKLTEDTWQQAPVAGTFIQRMPHEGAPASEQTEIRILYTSDAFYIGIRAYDSAPDSIAATLFRRDGSAYSDWIYASFDSYNDNRTGFSFGVNPRGIQRDLIIYNDYVTDDKWDAVWNAASTIDAAGWTVEMRIPLSQLRFSSNPDNRRWGINFKRVIARKEEESYWSPTPQRESGVVSNFGILTGISDLKEPSRLEITPYSSANLNRSPGNTNNPFYESSELSGSFGGDISYGLSSDLTVTATVNPDFGQVEADPAQINLSDFEIFYSEQRPFFLEGTDIFEYGETKTYNSFYYPTHFYSRRIGRSPTGNIGRFNRYHNQSVFEPDDTRAVHTDRPDQSTIASAVKLSGKTQNGWSVGVLDAYTVEETSPFRVNLMSGNLVEGAFPVEPATNYFVGRTRKELSDGNSVIGGFAGAVNRNIGNTYFENYLHSTAYTGGVDFEHNWDNRDWTVSGTLTASRVTGTSRALLKTQQRSSRYYNRVDSETLSLDSTRTALSGYFTKLSLQKSGGEHWKGSLTYEGISPGYEINDLGFQSRTDYRSISSALIYEENDPRYLRSYNLSFWTTQAWNFDGDLFNNWYAISGNTQFNNLWSVGLTLITNRHHYSDRLTRGGPLAKSPDDWNIHFNISTNQTKTYALSTSIFYKRDQSGGINTSYGAGLQVRPSPSVQLELSPRISYETDTGQYIQTLSDPLATQTHGQRYLFADLDRTTFSMSLRADWTFTPNLGLQTYFRTYISSGDYYQYKEFITPRSYDFAIYGKDRGTITLDEGTYHVDPDAGGPAEDFSFEDQDFNFRSFQTNTVLRWEYRPGSTIYLAWQQNRSALAQFNDFQFTRDLEGLFGTQPSNIFLVKLSYWFDG